MEEGSSKTYVFGQDGATVPAWLAYGNNGFGNGFGGGLGGGILGFLLGLLMFPVAKHFLCDHCRGLSE